MYEVYSLRGMVLIVNNLLTVFIKQSFSAEKNGFTKLFPAGAGQSVPIGPSKMRNNLFSVDLKQADLSSISQDRGIQMTDIERNKKIIEIIYKDSFSAIGNKGF